MASGILNPKMHFFFQPTFTKQHVPHVPTFKLYISFPFLFQKISKCFQFIFWPPWQHVITFFSKL